VKRLFLFLLLLSLLNTQQIGSRLVMAGPLGAASPATPVITPDNAAGLRVAFEKDFGDWSMVTALAWSPDGQWLAAGVSNTIYFFNADTYQPVSTISTGALTHSLAFHPSRPLLAAASRDGNLRVWDVSRLANEDAVLLWQASAHRKGANIVVFRPDGEQVVTGGSDGLARFWQVSDGKKLDYIIGGAFATPALAFLPDGRLAMVNGDMVRLREAETERILGSFKADANLYSLAVSPGGHWLAVGGLDNRVRLWETTSAFKTGIKNYPEPVVLQGHSGKTGTYRSLVWQVAFNPEGSLLASAGGDGSIRLWSVTLAQVLAAYPVHSLGATCVAFAPSGRLLATGGLDGRLVIWSAP
jgi:WD40 repeat protein